MRSHLLLLGLALSTSIGLAADGNRLAYLDESSPFWPSAKSPRLTTPQWVGEPGVEAVVVLAIDDMRDPAKYETFLRPILDRLKKIDGRAPVSIMTNTVTADDPRLQGWLQEGLSLEVHTLTHPCPCLGKATFEEAQRTYHGGVDLLASVPGNKPVAFRMPCCDSMNSASPRFYAELFNRVSDKGNYLRIDSSVFVRSSDPRFDKYFPPVMKPPSKVPMKDYVGTITDYPYPYVIGKLCWEFPCIAPSDWEAFNVMGSKSADMLADWKAALDWIVQKQGLMTTVFHPHGWSSPEQWVEFIDYAEKTHGKKVKFLTFREALERLEKNALAGVPLRDPASGQDQGVRVLDVDNDGFMDVVSGTLRQQKTRVWRPKDQRWYETPTPTIFAGDAKVGGKLDFGVKFGIMKPEGAATMLVKAHWTGAWTWSGDAWQADETLVAGLSGDPFNTGMNGRDTGVRLRDLDADGRCEMLVSNKDANAILEWNAADKAWKRADYALPEDVTIVDSEGRDAGLRLVDLNGDGFDDVLFSNEFGYSIYVWAGKIRNDLGWKKGWSHKVAKGTRGKDGWTPEAPLSEIPPFVRNGQNNGAWFHGTRLAVQNEDTLKLEANTWIRDFKDLIAFPVPPPKSPEESLKCMVPRPGFTVELVAAEPLIESPVAYEWDSRGRLWVVEMRDYPLGMDGKGKPGGRIKILTDENGDGRYDKAVTFAEDLPFPTGVFPIGLGAIVAAVPDILFLADEDGDGRAELRNVVFTGFKPGNQQHRMNGFEWGLDGWIYGGNGDSGGKITRGDGKGEAVNISYRDFRFSPGGEKFEPESGQVQFGRRRDDWGNWFGNNNSTWLWHYTVEDRYLRRNPKLAVKSVKQSLANGPEGQRVFTAYPLEASPTRMNQPQSLGFTTSACSPTPYRDDLFGPEFATSVFISEPMYNVVHREVLEPNGATFTSHRAADEKDREFLASTDQWFRPTMLKTGPDGALYVADMHRFILEHPEWIAPETQSRVDLRAGADKGRIFRVFPTDKRPRQIPDLSKLQGVALAAAMDSPSGWQRDTVQRLIRAEGKGADTDEEFRKLIGHFVRLAAEAKDPKVRVQAIAAMPFFRGPPLAKALRDPHPQVRARAIRAVEFAMPHASRREELEAILLCERDPDFIVRRQLAFTLGDFWRESDEMSAMVLAALERLAAREGNNEQMRIAILSSLKPDDALFAKLNAAPLAPAQAKTLNLPPASPDRAKVLASYAKVAGLKGDPARGHEFFKTQCALCHRLKGEGNDVGPDLGMVTDKPDDWLLIALLDPNAAIEARYQAVTLQLKSGAELAGLISAETGNNVTLRLPGGAEQAVLRDDIASQKSLGKSLMPEGLEAALDPQAVADLLAWLRAK